jgi:hypothetical protein
MKFLRRVGCLFIYTIFILIIGMGLYRYREQVLNFLNIKYNQTVEYVKDKTHDAKTEVKEHLPEIE